MKLLRNLPLSSIYCRETFTSVGERKEALGVWLVSTLATTLKIRYIGKRLHSKPSPLPKSFAWQIQLSLLHITFFKVIMMKYFSQGKCEFMNFLFVLLDKINILNF
jgi:hypothetical protein